MSLKVGDRLWSTCRGEVYGTITAVHSNGTVNIGNVSLTDLVYQYQKEDEETDYPMFGVDANAEEGERRGHQIFWECKEIHVALFSVPIVKQTSHKLCEGYDSDWKGYHAGYVELNTPGNGCGRCTRRLWIVRDEP